MNKKRWIALALCLMLCCSLLGSLCCIVRYADHRCCAPVCPECELLIKCKLFFLLLALGILLPLLLCAGAVPGRAEKGGAAFPRRACTPVSLKVKLLN